MWHSLHSADASAVAFSSDIQRERVVRLFAAFALFAFGFLQPTLPLRAHQATHTMPQFTHDANQAEQASDEQHIDEADSFAVRANFTLFQLHLPTQRASIDFASARFHAYAREHAQTFSVFHRRAQALQFVLCHFSFEHEKSLCVRRTCHAKTRLCVDSSERVKQNSFIALLASGSVDSVDSIDSLGSLV